MVRQSSPGPINTDADLGDEYEYVEVEERQGCSGCGWGLAGLAGCLLIPMAGALLLFGIGLNTLGSLLFDVSCAVNPDANRCIDSDDRPAVLVSVRELSTLLTVERIYDRTITTQVDIPYALRGLYGDSLTLRFVMQVNAGFDLTQMTVDNIVVDGRELFIQLPPPQLQTCVILENETQILDRDRGLFTQGTAVMDTVARQDAIDAIRDQAVEEGILNEANEHSVEALQLVYGGLPLSGFDSVQILTTPPDPANTVIAPSCIGRDDVG